MLAANHLSSLILWGNPGCGKTTIARLLAGAFDLKFLALSAIFSGVGDLKKAFEQAKEQLSRYSTNLHQRYGQGLELRSYAVVALGLERLLWREIQ